MYPRGYRPPPWHWRYILIPLREYAWYPIKRLWYHTWYD